MKKLNLIDAYVQLIQEKYEEYKDIVWVNPVTGRKNHIGYILNDLDNPLYDKAYAYLQKLKTKSTSTNKSDKEETSQAKSTLSKIEKQYKKSYKTLEKFGIDKMREEEDLSWDEYKDNLFSEENEMFDQDNPDDVSIAEYIFGEMSAPIQLDDNGKVVEDEEQKQKRDEVITQSLKKGNWDKLIILAAVATPLLAWHLIKKYKKKMIEADKKKFLDLKNSLKDFWNDEIKGKITGGVYNDNK